MFLFSSPTAHGRPARLLSEPVGSAEHRLIHKTVSPEAPKETPEAGKEKTASKPKAEGDKVKEESKKTKDAVKDAVPEVEAPPPAEQPETTTEGPHYLQMPPITEAIRDTRNAVLTSLGIALPPLGIAGLAGAGTMRYLGRKISGQPLSIGHAAADTFVRAPVEGVKSILRTLAFPFRWAGAAGINSLKFTGDKLYSVLDAVILEPYREITGRLVKGKDAELAEGEKKGVHPISALYAGGKWVVWDGPKSLVTGYLNQLIKHPGRTLIGTAVGVPILWGAFHNFGGVYEGAASLGNAIIRILEGIAGKLGA